MQKIRGSRKLKFVKMFVATCVFVLLPSIALAHLTVKNPEVVDVAGKPVSNGVVQMIIGDNTTTPGQDPYFTGSLHSTQFPNTDNNGVSNMTIQDLPLNTSVYIKAWKTSPGPGQYYGFYGPANTGSATQTLRWDSPKITTKYKAAKPPKPKATAGGFSLSYDANTGRYLPTFTISAVDQSDPNEPGILFETVGYNIAIRKKGDNWDPARVFSQKSKTITETDPDNPYFVADGKTEYEVRAQAWNYFGGNTDADWGESYFFKIPASGGAGGVPTTFTFDLYGAQPNKLMVNSITIPSNNLKSPEEITVSKASDLAGVINRKAGKNIVRAICRWNTKEAKAEAALFDDKGELTSIDFEVSPGVGYQLYTTEDLPTLTFEAR